MLQADEEARYSSVARTSSTSEASPGQAVPGDGPYRNRPLENGANVKSAWANAGVGVAVVAGR